MVSLIFFVLFCVLFFINANSVFIFCNQSSGIKKILFQQKIGWFVFYVLSIIDGFILSIVYEYVFNPQAQMDGIVNTVSQKNGYFYTTLICFHIVCSVFGFVYLFLWKKIHKPNS